MAYIDITITHNGTNITDYVISYNREKYICTGIGTISVTVLDNGRFYDEWDTIVLYEEGTKKGTYYIKSKRREKGAIVIEAQDGSTKLVDYFVDESTQFDYVTYTRFWIEKYLNEAGVDYTINADGQGAPINRDYPVGLATAFEIITGFLQMSNWYMYFNANNRCIIGSLSLHSGSPRVRLQDDRILSIRYNKNDKMLRNRAVVWGGTDPWSGTWIYADISVNTRWNYSSSDKRAVVLANSTIYSVYDAQRLARIMLNEFSRITEVKIVEVAGNLNLELGDYAFIDSKFQRGGGMVTTIESSMSKGGFITTITLDQRCPRLFGFVGYITDYVYIGTDGAGVWRKELDGSTWMDYSQGITDLGITDLSINNGVFGTTTNTGLLFYKYIYGLWTQFNPDSAYFPSGTMPSGTSITASGVTQSGVYATCVTVDKVDNSIYGGFTTNSGVLGSGWAISGLLWSGAWQDGDSWVVKLDSNGNFLRSDKIMFTSAAGVNIEHVTIVDIDNNERENILSVLAPGIIPVMPGDDGNFGEAFCVSPIALSVAVGDTIGSYSSFTTDYPTLKSSLPDANQNFETLQTTTGNGGIIGYGSNTDYNSGTWWTAYGIPYTTDLLYIREEGFDSIPDEFGEYWRIWTEYEITMPNGDAGHLDGFLKNPDNDSFTIVCSEVVSGGTVFNLRVYEFNSTSQEITLKDSFTQTTLSTFNESGMIQKVGHKHVFAYELYYDVGGIGVLPTRRVVAVNMYNQTIVFPESPVAEQEGTDKDYRFAWKNPPTIVGDYIVFSHWRMAQEGSWAYPLAWAMGKFGFCTDAISCNGSPGNSVSITPIPAHHDGHYHDMRNFNEKIEDPDCEPCDCSADSSCCVDCCSMGILNSPTFNGQAGAEGHRLRASWAISNRDTMISWGWWATDLVYVRPQNMPPPYEDPMHECHRYDDIPNMGTAHRFLATYRPPNANYMYASENEGEYPYGRYPTTPVSVEDWDMDASALPWMYEANGWHDIFASCGSSERNEYYVITGHATFREGENTDENGYDIWRVSPNTLYIMNALTLCGHISTTEEGRPGASYTGVSWKMKYVLPQVDDIDGTIYTVWNDPNSPSSSYLVGYSSDGTITKRIYQSGIGGSSIFGNALISQARPYFGTHYYPITYFAKWVNYEQISGQKNFILRQKDADIEEIYESLYKLNVDTSKSSPTVIYHPTISGEQTSFLGTSIDNIYGSVLVRNTSFPILDVRTFDITDPTMFVVESGATDSGYFRYIGIVNSGGFYAIDALLTAASGISITTASGASASGTTFSGLTHLETTNIAMSGTPYFFVAAPSGFWQRNPGSPTWLDYSYSLPGNTITIIRADDRI